MPDSPSPGVNGGGLEPCRSSSEPHLASPPQMGSEPWHDSSTFMSHILLSGVLGGLAGLPFWCQWPTLLSCVPLISQRGWSHGTQRPGSAQEGQSQLEAARGGWPITHPLGREADASRFKVPDVHFGGPCKSTSEPAV